ncbi:heparinase II/III domain-containing protein [Novipirellula artificiosorum]|uniref:Heparinase II/III-like protein n=1 Tax=Novipirellula artificiosorum TaxID=2528016 RepID=A0A5C6DUU7_9BACT|nr:heparinase II/III family protein [Novipirellula artificiosorum]TWU39707.1 Heparinase II/III-like protein [Novipirellula artificiosorum]
MLRAVEFKSVCYMTLALLVSAASTTVAHTEETKQPLARQVKRGLPLQVQQAFGFEDARLWSGGTPVTSPRRSGAAMKWEKHTKNPTLECRLSPFDLSAFNVMSFWLHSNQAGDATFMVILPSTREKGTNSYYSNKITVDWEGWKKINLHFRSFGKAREPKGWDHIDSIRFAASGWDQEPTDEPVWVLDELDFEYTTEPYRPMVAAKKYVPEPDRSDYLDHLRPGHPRLILLDEDLPQLRQFIESDERGKAWYRRAKESAERLYKLPVRKHELPDGRRLLSISRDVVNRIYHWGFFYRIEGDKKWLDRACQELEAVVAFPDWNPNHYLDTAEMMHAVAIGYDWFYPGLTEQQRKTIRDGLYHHGLRLSYAAYMGLEAEGTQSWRHVTNNWNFVCNGGTGLAAMALLDEMPDLCTEILDQGFQYIQIPLEHFEPDGAWWEGVGYWGYSMRYLVPYLRGLETAFGTDFGFIHSLQGTGFAQAGDFPVYLVSPLGGIYNFADSGSGGGKYKHSQLFYLASRFQNPLYQYFQEQQTSGGLEDLLYYEPLETKTTIRDIPLDKYFRGTEVATLRSSWTDRDAAFVGIKCGRNGIAHAHQDLGSFIFYALGEEWLIDLGTEHQTYLSHQHHLSRSEFYRIREEGHNTLVFNPGPGYSQGSKATAKIERFETSPDDVFAIADLTDAYRQHATSVKRGYRLFDDRTTFLIQDEFTAKKKSDVWWFAHGAAGTDYSLDDSGKVVTLRRGNQRCQARLLSPAGAKFQVMDAAPLPTSPNPNIQETNDGMKKLAVHLEDTQRETIAILFVPQMDEKTPKEIGATPSPLEDWKLQHK